MHSQEKRVNIYSNGTDIIIKRQKVQGTEWVSQSVRDGWRM